MPRGKHVLGMSKGRHIDGTVKVGEKGQIVIPKEARSHFGIQTGDTLLVLGDEKSGLIISRPEAIRELAMQILAQMDETEAAPENDGKDEEE